MNIEEFINRETILLQAIEIEILKKIINNYESRKTNNFFDKILMKSGQGAYSWLKWLHLQFKKPIVKFNTEYIGIQIYPYSIKVEEIGQISQEIININKYNDKNIFPYSYKNRKLLSNNIAIDMETGNIMKQDKDLEEIQLWLCQHYYKYYEGKGDHACILKNGYKDDGNLKEFHLNNKYEFVQKYYNQLLIDKNVSKSVLITRKNWETKIYREINNLVGDKII